MISWVLPLVFSEPRMFESLNVMSGYFNAAAVSVVPVPAAIILDSFVTKKHF